MSARSFEPTVISNGVASLQIASDEAPNLCLADLASLREVVASIGDRADIRALVIEGGTHRFCAGADRELLLRPDAAEAIHELVGGISRLVLSIPVPTVAALVGHAVGGGLMLGLWCDAAILAEEALYTANFVSLGFTPGMGSTSLLPDLLGPALARELLLTGRAVTGGELGRLAPALAHAVFPRTEVRARAIALAEEFAQAPAPAVRVFKAELASQRRVKLEDALATERRMHASVFADPQTHANILQNYI